MTHRPNVPLSFYYLEQLELQIPRSLKYMEKLDPMEAGGAIDLGFSLIYYIG